jgi:tetratricopeptide (TPR) repeat protein
MALNDLGTIQYRLGQYAVAEPFYKRSLALREKTLGSDHAEIAMVLNNLGDLYRAQGRFVDAATFLKRSISITEKSRGPDDLSIVLALSTWLRSPVCRATIPNPRLCSARNRHPREGEWP